MSVRNSNIRQLQCTMAVTAAISSTYDNRKRNGSDLHGKAVSLDSNGGNGDMVDIITADELVFGQLQSVEPDGEASVTDEGYIDLPTDGSTIVIGRGLIGGSVDGTVKSAAAGAALNCIAIAKIDANNVRARIG